MEHGDSFSLGPYWRMDTLLRLSTLPL